MTAQVALRRVSLTFSTKSTKQREKESRIKKEKYKRSNKNAIDTV